MSSSTIVYRPETRAQNSKWCYKRCNLNEFDYSTKTRKRRNPVNTVIRCNKCDRLWVVKRSVFEEVFFEPYYVLRPLRWYHRAGWGLKERQDA